MNAAHRTTVLIVDDDDAVRRSLALLLEDEGYTVLTAACQEQALQVLAEQPCTVAIVDLRLAHADGEMLITKLNRLYPGMRFLIHTGSLSFQITGELAELGMTDADVLRKPLLDLSVMFAAIERVAPAGDTAEQAT